MPLTQGNKFAKPWTGPWRVIAKVTEVNYRISLLSNPKKTRVVHYDYLKPFEGSADTPVHVSTDNDVRSNRHEDIATIRDLYAPWTVTTPSDPEDPNDNIDPPDTICDDSSSSKQSDTDTRYTRPQRVRRKPSRLGFSN